MRLACLHVPDFPLAALLRVRPELGGELIAVADGDGPRARLLAASPEAARRGVSVGITVAQGRAIEARLAAHVVSIDALRAAQAALCDAAESFSPRVEDSGDGVVYCDLAGLHTLYENESQLANAIARRAAYLGLPAQVGVAGSKIAAYLAARDGGGVAVIPSGEEWSFLAPVPVSLLHPGPRLADTLRLWGIRTIGQLAALPANAIGTRLGPEGVALVARARGEDAHPLVPRAQALQFEEGIELDYGIETIEPLLFLLRPLLERLTARLAVRGLVCGDLRLSLRLSNRGRDDRTVAVSAPSNDVKSLLTLIRVYLEVHPPAAAIEELRVSAAAEKLRAAQLDLFQPSGPAPAQLAVTLARLAAICGNDRVGMPVVCDDHRPDAYGADSFSTRPLPNPPPFAKSAHGGGDAEIHRQLMANTLPLALRAFRPPQAVEVFYDRDRPEFVRGESVSGRVVQIAGPWRHSGHWWSDQRYVRDYYDAQLSDGGVYRLFRDLEAGGWFVAGSYD